MSSQLNELRLQVERLNYDSKESSITIDILKEQNEDAKNELEELRKTISDMRVSQKDVSVEDKEKRKQEKMALMMAKFDTVSDQLLCLALTKMCSQQGTFSEKDEQLRSILSKLDSIDNEGGISSLTVDDVASIRRQLQDGQNLIRETVDRLRQSQEESEMNMRRRDEVEARLAALEAEYEELLGAFFSSTEFSYSLYSRKDNP
jgi:kinesin family protein 5